MDAGPSEWELEEEIDTLLFYRKMPTLGDMVPDSDCRSTIISMYRLTRHILGESTAVWFRMVFGQRIKISY